MSKKPPPGFAPAVRVGPQFEHPTWEVFDRRAENVGCLVFREGPGYNGLSVGMLGRGLPSADTGGGALWWGLSGELEPPKHGRRYEALIGVRDLIADGGGQMVLWVGISLLSGSGAVFDARWQQLGLASPSQATLLLDTAIEQRHTVELGLFIEIGWGNPNVPNVKAWSGMSLSYYERLPKDGEAGPTEEVPGPEESSGRADPPPALRSRDRFQERVFPIQGGTPEPRHQ